MNEFLAYIKMIKGIIDADYEKERVFYDSGIWYDRHKSGNISLDELHEILQDIFNSSKCQYEQIIEYENKLVEVLGEKEAEEYIDKINSKYYEA